ncbi:MAG: complex I NDUFA9 subunit family protein [Chloroflexi bacterium]|nr:complex I NDUFA9 subunit family protein [Chloroflexota bacterium]
MSTILVTGASGFVGSHVTPALLDAGHRVVALVRSRAAGERVLARLPAGQRQAVELRAGDVTELATLVPALAGVDAVVHLVALPRDWDNGASLRLVNTEGTRNLVAAMATAGIRRLVHLGALGVADDPSLHYAASKARAEAIVAASGLEWTILEPSLLYGPRDGFFNILAGLVRISPVVVPMPGSGAARFQPLAIEDLARAVVASIADPASTTGRSIQLGGPRYWTYREILEEVLRGMGSRRVIVPMPVPLIRLVAGAAERVRLPFPVATDQLRQLKLDNVGPLTSVRDAFGFEPRDMAGGLGHLRRKPRAQEPDLA